MRRFLALAIVNVLMLGLIIHLGLERPKQLAKGVPGIFEVNILNVSNVRLSKPGHEAFWALERNRLGWTLTHPRHWCAQASLVEAVLRSIQFQEAQETFTLEELEEAGKTLQDYGIDPDAFVLDLTQEGELRRFRLAFDEHRTSVFDTKKNVLFLLEPESLSELNQPSEDFLQKTLFGFYAFQVESLQIEDSQEKVVRLEKNAKRWSIELPIVHPADGAAIEAALAQLAQTPITPLDTQIDSERLKTPPAQHLRLFSSNGSETLHILEPEQEDENVYWVQREGFGMLFKVPKESLDPFLRPLDVLRERAVLSPIGPSTMTELEICNDQRCVRLYQGEDALWRVEADKSHNPIRVDEEVLKDRIKDLQLLRVEAFVQDAPSPAQQRQFGLDKPQLRLRIRTPKGSKTLLIGGLDTQTNTLYAQDAEFPYVYTVPLRLLDRFPPDAHAYRTRILKQYPKGSQLMSLSVTDVTTGNTLLESTLELPLGHHSFLEQRTLLFRVRDYMPYRFSETELIVNETQRLPWRYRIEARIRTPESRNGALQVFSFLATQRVGSDLQYAGAEGLIFTLDSSWIDVFAQLLPAEHLEQSH